MVIKQVLNHVVVVAMLFAATGVSAARKIVGQDAEALMSAPVAQPEVVKSLVDLNQDDAMVEAEDDQILLNQGALKDLALQEKDMDLDFKEDDSDDAEALAQGDDFGDPFDSAQFEKMMESPEMKLALEEAQKEIEKLTPEQRAEMDAQVASMMQAMQSGEDFDFGSLMGTENSELPAA